ncbi:MAG: hypothetical protein Q7O12_04265 [Deltaproteobacteria bacterium]|nr:hypothetical protein [Deltaproteobacteria bacterium]
MLKLTDSGCVEHHPQPIRLTGQAAALVGRLVLNLPPTEAGHTYICEHGHTHCLTLQSREGNVTSTPPRFGFKGNPPLNH